MEGIRTADAILSRNYPKTDFEQKDKVKAAQATVEIAQLKMGRVKELVVPFQDISLIINHRAKL